MNMILLSILFLLSLSNLCLSNKQILRRKDVLQSFKSDRVFLSHVKYFDEVRRYKYNNIYN